jgi:tetratricopeptide (TPR) repeat protein
VRAEAALAALAALERAVASRAREVDADIASARGLLREKSVRLRYKTESETMPIRIQLASYYVKSKDLELAARQLRAVLRIDPANVSARYLLGSVYRWQGRWAEAQDAFYAVYLADPGYEQAAAFYNGIALEKAASASSSVGFSIDSGRSAWSFSSGYSAHLGQGMRLDALLDASFAHARDAAWGEASWGVQRLKLGLELDMGDAKASPFAGVALTGDSILGALDPPSFASGFGDFGKTRPFAGVDLALRLGEAARFSASYAYGPWLESLSSYGEAVMAHDAELNLSLDPGAIGFLDFLGMRLYGRNASIEDGADILTALASVDLYLYRGGNPYSAISIGAQAIWQDSVLDPRAGAATRYWRPDQVLTIEGVASYGLWGAKGLGLSAQIKAGAYLDEALGPSPESLLKLGAYLGLEYSSELARVALVADFSGTRPFDLGSAFVYSSLALRLEGSVKLPNYLVRRE